MMLSLSPSKEQVLKLVYDLVDPATLGKIHDLIVSTNGVKEAHKTAFFTHFEHHRGDLSRLLPKSLVINEHPYPNSSNRLFIRGTPESAVCEIEEFGHYLEVRSENEYAKKIELLGTTAACLYVGKLLELSLKDGLRPYEVLNVTKHLTFNSIKTGPSVNDPEGLALGIVSFRFKIGGIKLNGK